MSDGHGHDHEHDDAAEAHDDHGFDGEPARELGPEEPATPMWLPGLGAAIFVLGAVFLLASGATENEGASAPPRPAPPVMTNAAPKPAPTAAAAAPGSVNPVRKLSPDQLKDLQKRIQEAQEKRKQQGTDGAK